MPLATNLLEVVADNEVDGSRVPIWVQNPYQLVSWWDMAEFIAHPFCRMCADLELLQETVVAARHRRGDWVSLLPDETDLVLQSIAKINFQCAVLELDAAMARVQRIHGLLAGNNCSLMTLQHETRVLSETIEDQLKHRLFLYVPLHKAQFYRNPEALFGEEVKNAFPSAVNDIYEAGKCYALGRNTACVFHLMRVMEVGLRALGASLNDPSLDPKKNPTWDMILQKGDKELSKSYAQRSPEWQSKPKFFADAHANLRAVKDAWRNPTMHVETNYDEDKARAVFNSVKSFMQHLATELHE